MQHHCAANYLQNNRKTLTVVQGKRRREEFILLYWSIKIYSSLQFYCTAADTTCTPLHNLPCALIFCKHSFTILEGLLICNTPIIGTKSLHPPSTHSPIIKNNYLSYVRPTAVLQGQRFLFLHLIFGGPRTCSWNISTKVLPLMSPCREISLMQENNLGDVLNIGHASLTKHD